MGSLFVLFWAKSSYQPTGRGFTNENILPCKLLVLCFGSKMLPVRF